MWTLALLTSLGGIVTDFELLTQTGDLDRLLSVHPSGAHRSRLRDAVLLHNVLGSFLHMPLQPGGGLLQPDAVAQEIDRVNASRVLELGYGKGFNTLRLASSRPAVNFVAVDDGLDAVVEASKRARRRGLRNVSFKSANITTLDCAKSFDAVFSIESLRFTDPATLFEVVRRCLRPGGALVLIDAFTADGVAEAAGEARTALRLVESGLRTRAMPSVSHWRTSAQHHGFALHREWDWTSRALPFWDAGAVGARKAMAVYRWLPAAAQGHVVASVMAPHALRGGAVRYGGVVLHREL